MISLAQLIEQFDHKQAAIIPSDWLQGRTVYGGLTASLAVEAVLQAGIENLPPLRSAYFAFVGPASPSITYRSRVLRAGKSVTSVEAECISEGGPALNAIMVFAHGRPSAIQHDEAIRPVAKRPEECLPWPLEIAPNFLQHFDLRAAGGSVPFSGSSEPELMAWVRHKDAKGVDPIVALIAMADCLPPAATSLCRGRSPLSSITWTVDILGPVPDSEWFLFRSRAQQAGNGYSSEDMEIWTESGQRLLWGRQTVAIFS